MARYINKDEFIAQIQDNFCTECNNYDGVKCKSCGIDDTIEMVENADEADVVPKSEVEKLKADLIVWKQDRFNFYQRLELYEMARQKVAREIFEEIDNSLYKFAYPSLTAIGTVNVITAEGFHIRISDYNALKKKYTEGVKEDTNA